MYKNIKIKKDGTFIVDYNGMPFHITEDYPTADTYGIEMTYAEVKKYADSHQDEVREYEEPVYTLDPKIEKEILISNKEKEQLELIANILTDSDVDFNKAKLKDIIREIKELKKTITDNTVSPNIITLQGIGAGNNSLKGNTRYRISTNAEDIIAIGSRVSIKLDLWYSRHDNSKTNNPQEEKLITSIEWYSNSPISSSSITFKTSNYINENNIHKINLINDGNVIGELSKPIEVYLEEEEDI